MNSSFTTEYTLDGVKRLIKHLENTLQISLYDLAKRSSVTPAAIYAILNRKDTKNGRKVRKKTIIGFAQGCGYSVRFRDNQIILHRVASPGNPRSREYEKFADEIIDLTRRLGHKLTRGLQKKILKVIEVMAG